MNARHIYVHVPFCERRCSYCSFAIAVRRSVPAREYVRAIEDELLMRFRPKDTDEPLLSLYLGGGTPSHLGAEGVADLIDTVSREFIIDKRTEITLEANPEDVSLEAVQFWQAGGVNRVSLGIQSFSDAALSWMHRVHDSRRATSALEIITSEFSDVSADLIFALPDSVQRDLRSDVDQLIASGVAHISLYGLTNEPRTVLSRWVDRGEVTEAGEERYEREFLELHNSLTSAGFDHYEVSNFAKPGYRSVHNSAYWSGADYIGVGPAAHGFDGMERRWNISNYSDWLAAVQSGLDPIEGREELSDDNRVAEEVYLGLRAIEGLDLSSSERQLVEPWVASSWGVVEGSNLRLTALGWLRLDSLAASLTHFRSR